MGSALYIVAQKEVFEFDMHVNGKALAGAEEGLGAICTRIGVRSPMEFFSQDPEALAEMLGEEMPDAPPEQWFAASDGLNTVRALLSRLESGAESIQSVHAVIDDLRSCERVLAHLYDTKNSWHFAIDI